ncbi:MAG: class 1 fructose-bisphosphatase [Acidobacteria bacterium]|nr:class 1 fructose-bisphosphatase [Acidobacteriota bacterium]
MPQKLISLTYHLLQEDQVATKDHLEFSRLLTQITMAARIITQELRRAGLADMLGKTGAVNVQQEEVKKLDEFANETLISACEESGLVFGAASEELKSATHFHLHGRSGAAYAVLFDPLDGSSNTDVNGSLGSIFSIFRRRSLQGVGTDADLLRAGRELFAAGYILYGPSIMLVYSRGLGVHAFTLDPGVGQFFESHYQIRMPAHGAVYSINEGIRRRWQPGIAAFIDRLQSEDSPAGKPYSTRYTGCLTADFHRILLEGGVFLYPEVLGNDGHYSGKLRLLYEAMPLAYLAHNAGGRGSTGLEPILDIQPTSLHQRVGLILGSQAEVHLAEQIISEAVSEKECESRA